MHFKYIALLPVKGLRWSIHQILDGIALDQTKTLFQSVAPCKMKDIPAILRTDNTPVTKKPKQ